MRPALKLTNDDWLAVERELCKRSLADFTRLAWHVLEPGNPYVHGWHIDAMAEHLEAVTNGEINRLLINVPPGTMKSMLTSVFWPAWEWGPRAMPTMRYVGASHELSLAIRDNRKMRLLVSSEWYQRLWPTPLVGDQNEKIKFENQATGFRQANAMKSMTGNRGDRVIIDDPHNVEGALSKADRERDIREFRETVPTRLNSPEKSAIIVVMQRLHEEDVSGLILSEDFGYEHLCLPMEFESERRCVTSIGFADPRIEDGELLFPERFPIEVVERDKKMLGSLATAGQFQQRPAPRSGGFFQWDKFEIVPAGPVKVRRRVRFWDKAGTKDGGAFTAGVRMALAMDGGWYVEDVVRGQWSAGKREAIIKQTATLDPPGTIVWVEQEPGSGGKESAEATIRNLAGFAAHADRVTGSKEERALPYAVQVEAGNVKLIDGAWVSEFIEEHKTFPRGKFKDQVDAAAGAFSKLTDVTVDYRKLL